MSSLNPLTLLEARWESEIEQLRLTFNGPLYAGSFGATVAWLRDGGNQYNLGNAVQIGNVAVMGTISTSSNFNAPGWYFERNPAPPADQLLAGPSGSLPGGIIRPYSE